MLVHCFCELQGDYTSIASVPFQSLLVLQLVVQFLLGFKALFFNLALEPTFTMLADTAVLVGLHMAALY